MQRKIKTRQTLGLNARIFVSPDQVYSTQATFGAFVDNAVDGEIGIFEVTPAMTGDFQATIMTAAPVALGTGFFIAQMQIGTEKLAKKTPTVNFGETTHKNFEAFCLPVNQISAIGFNGTGGDLQDVVPVITVGDNYEISIIETTEGHQPYPTWQYSYTANITDQFLPIVDGVASIVLALQRQINDDLSIQNKENEPIVIAETLLGSFVALLTDVAATTVNGSAIVSTTITGVTGDIVRIDGVAYKIVSAAAGTMVLDSPYVGVSAAGTAVVDSTDTFAEVGLRFTSLLPDDTFAIALKEGLQDALNTLLQGFKEGTGYREHIANVEYEGQIFDGTTTVNVAFKDDFGSQNNYRDNAKAYDVIMCSYDATTNSKALPNSHDSQIGHLMVAGVSLDALPGGDYSLPLIGAGGTNVITNVKAVFGLI